MVKRRLAAARRADADAAVRDSAVRAEARGDELPGERLELDVDAGLDELLQLGPTLRDRRPNRTLTRASSVAGSETAANEILADAGDAVATKSRRRRCGRPGRPVRSLCGSAAHLAVARGPSRPPLRFKGRRLVRNVCSPRAAERTSVTDDARAAELPDESAAAALRWGRDHAADPEASRRYLLWQWLEVKIEQGFAVTAGNATLLFLDGDKQAGEMLAAIQERVQAAYDAFGRGDLDDVEALISEAWPAMVELEGYVEARRAYLCPKEAAEVARAEDERTEAQARVLEDAAATATTPFVEGLVRALATRTREHRAQIVAAQARFAVVRTAGASASSLAGALFDRARQAARQARPRERRASGGGGPPDRRSADPDGDDPEPPSGGRL